MLFTQGTPGGDRWFVEEVDLVSGTSTRLAEGPEVTLAPHGARDGRVLISARRRRGPARARRHAGCSPPTGLASSGFSAQRKGLIIGLHERPSEFPELFALKDGKPVPCAAPADSRLDVAGVTP